MNDFGIIKIKFGNEFRLILFRDYISPKLFAVHQIKEIGKHWYYVPILREFEIKLNNQELLFLLCFYSRTNAFFCRLTCSHLSHRENKDHRG
jgi:hypothetical protein